MESTRDTGNRGETLVCERIIRRGMSIIDRNVREKFAEIDIVAMDRDTLCFIEVRSRQDTTMGHPSETISPKKQRTVRRAAEAYLVKRNITGVPIRFDVATIVWSSMEFLYFENAF
jgi:putative endonuclease